jgi:hypothetical protein
MASGTNNGDWIRTLIGAISAVCIAVSGMYTVVILPMAKNIDKLETGREDDRKQLDNRYLSLRENDQYKIFAQAERTALRGDLLKSDAHILRIEEEQKRRTSNVSSIPSLEKRIDATNHRLEEAERRFSGSYTLGDELKSLRAELQDLRRRIMVPVTKQ